MRADEIREMSVDDVLKRVHELEEEQFRLKFRSATEPLEDPLQLRVIRRNLARLKTVLREQHTSKPAEPKAAMPAAKKTAKPAKAGAARARGAN